LGKIVPGIYYLKFKKISYQLYLITDLRFLELELSEFWFDTMIRL